MLSQRHGEPSLETLNDIRARLGRVCQNYSDEEFNALVRRIASIKAKYEAIRVEGFREAARQLASVRPDLVTDAEVTIAPRLSGDDDERERRE